MFRLILLSGMAAFAAWAQSTGAATVVGTVTDKSGAVVPGAKVTVRNLGTQFISSGQTNSAGAYYVPSLNSGTYEVAVEATGFKKFVQTGLVLRINESPRIDVQLEVGNVTESVKVDATAPLLETETAGSGQVLDGELVEKLPVMQKGSMPVEASGLSGHSGLFGSRSTPSVRSRPD